MFQKIQKAFEKFVKEKGQGTVEYALILGFVAIIAIYMMNRSGLKDQVQQNVGDAKAAGAAIHSAYGVASGTGGASSPSSPASGT